MSNIDQLTLTSLLKGKLAFKVFNKDNSSWEILRIGIPELEAHTGAKATTNEPGHVMLVTDLESESEELAATAKAVSIAFEAVSAHVNDEESHITPMERIKWDGNSFSKNIGYEREGSALKNVKEAIDELFATQTALNEKVTNSMATLAAKLTEQGKDVPEDATLEELVDLV